MYCAALVQKSGGCNHMTCRCGRDFNWDLATPIVGCPHFHCGHRPGASFSKKGWHCCPHCTPAARKKLALAKTARAAALAPVVVPAAAAAGAAAAGVAAAGAGVALAVAAVPAVIFGPMALVYEPIRRVRNAAERVANSAMRRRNRPRRHRNPFASAAGSGAWAVANGLFVGCMVLNGYDSD